MGVTSASFGGGVPAPAANGGVSGGVKMNHASDGGAMPSGANGVTDPSCCCNGNAPASMASGCKDVASPTPKKCG